MVSALRAERQSVAYGQSPHHEPRPPPVRPQGAPAVLPVLCLVLVGGTLFFMRAWMGGLRKTSLETLMDASGSNDTASAISSCGDDFGAKDLSAEVVIVNVWTKHELHP